jgi:glycosyltransferase involved in cell wall biosynthesis
VHALQDVAGDPEGEAMRLIFVSTDKAGCLFHRLLTPIHALSKRDRSFQADPVGPRLVIAKGRLVAISDDLREADCCILQRPTTVIEAQLQDMLQRAGVAVVVEVDDDLHRLHAANSASAAIKPVHLAYLKRCCEKADLVTVTTPVLARRYARHGRYRILPNYVPDAWTRFNSDGRFGKESAIVVGWPGTVATHPTDLQATLGGCGTAVKATGSRFRVIGRPDLVQRNLGLSQPPDVVPWTNLAVYPSELARLDVGIAPLARVPFNRAKSWIKPLELTAAGVPVVMSDYAEYRRLHDYGIGVLASTASEWHDAIVALIRDRGLRAWASVKGREIVREHLTVERHCFDWLDAWSEAVRHRSGKTRRVAA